MNRVRIGERMLRSAACGTGFALLAACGGIVETQPKPVVEELPVPFTEPSSTAVPPAPPAPLAPPVPPLRGEWITPKEVSVRDFAVDANGIYLSTQDADGFAKVQSCPSGAGCTTAAAATPIYSSPEPVSSPIAIAAVSDLFFAVNLKSANGGSVIKRVPLPAVGAVPVTELSTKPLFNVRHLSRWGTELIVGYSGGSLALPNYLLLYPKSGAISELGGPNARISARNESELYQRSNGSTSLSVWTRGAGGITNRDVPETRVTSLIRSEFILVTALPNRIIVDRAQVGILACPYGEAILCKTSIPVRTNTEIVNSRGLQVHDGVLYAINFTSDLKPQLVGCAVATLETTGACAWNTVWSADEKSAFENEKLISTSAGLYGLFGERVIRLRP
jgi:hypothetical protein